MNLQALCHTCGKLISVREDGEFRVHGKRNARCRGRRSSPRRVTFPVGRSEYSVSVDEARGLIERIERAILNATERQIDKSNVCPGCMTFSGEHNFGHGCMNRIDQK